MKIDPEVILSRSKDERRLRVSHLRTAPFQHPDVVLSVSKNDRRNATNAARVDVSALRRA